MHERMSDRITILTYLATADDHCSLSEIADENHLSIRNAIAELVHLGSGGWVTEKNTFRSRLCYVITEQGLLYLRRLISDKDRSEARERARPSS